MNLDNIIFLWNALSKRRHTQFLLLIPLMIIASFFEVVSLGAILPFLGVLTSPESVFKLSILQPVIEILNISSPTQLLIPATVGFILAVLSSGLVRLILLYALTRFTHAVGTDLSRDTYRNMLFQKYSVHLDRNSGHSISIILEKTRTTINGIISPILNLFSSLLIIFSVLVSLFFIDHEAAIYGLTVIGFLYFVLISFSRRRLARNSLVINSETSRVFKALQEGFGGIRDVIIDGSQEFFCKYFEKSNYRMRRTIADNVFISQSPKYIVESFGMIFIASLAFYMTERDGGLSMVIPVLGAIALAAQKLLPLMQTAYGSYSSLKGSSASFEEVIDLLRMRELEQTRKNIKPIIFHKELTLRGISFRYKNGSNWVLKNLNLNIKKGSTIGFIGPSGSGKTTLLDIVMGLLEPTEGEILVDNKPISGASIRSWQTNIAHVPQNIFLSDTTIKENIAFGVTKDLIEIDRLRAAAKNAQIDSFIESLEFGYDSRTGERGVSLSGGQRQRIGIARALYKNADFLVLDEATSSLDNKTEELVMKSLMDINKNLTVLIIAHRLTTLKACDYIVKIDGIGKVQVGSYVELIGK